MPSPEQLAWLQTAAVAAFAAEKMTGCPAELSVAQGILESSWGANGPGNNLFGVKEYPGCSGRQLLRTSEWLTDVELAQFLGGDPDRTATPVTDAEGNPVVSGARTHYRVMDWFATFPTMSASFVKHALIVTSGRYEAAFKAFTGGGHLEDFVRAIAPIYATAPGYGDTLMQLINQTSAQAAIAAARA